jgi:hypothetical protein
MRCCPIAQGAKLIIYSSRLKLEFTVIEKFVDIAWS